MIPFHGLFFLSFDKDQLVRIHWLFWKGRLKTGKLNKQTFVKFGDFSHYIFVIFLQITLKVGIFTNSRSFPILFSRVDGFSLTGPTQKLKKEKIRTFIEITFSYKVVFE